MIPFNPTRHKNFIVDYWFLDGCNTFKFNCYWSRQGLDLYCRPARLIGLEIFTVKPVKNWKINLHICKKYGYIHQLVPT